MRPEDFYVEATTSESTFIVSCPGVEYVDNCQWVSRNMFATLETLMDEAAEHIKEKHEH
jgi:hypothetical protein